GEEIGLKIDQTLTQDATGTMVMLELEAMNLDRVKTEVSAQYVDHNLIQGDYRNPDDQRLLRSAARKFGAHHLRPGRGVRQPVHHTPIQDDYRNPDDHTFLRSASRKFGVHYSRPGNGVSHPVHMQELAIPGKTLLGSDSHTCANGCMGMLAMGAGGIDVAMAMA